MGVDFSEQRWQQVKNNYDLWWSGQLDRPLIQVVFTDCDPGRDEPDLPSYNGVTAFYGLDTPPQAIVDRWDYYLSSLKYAGSSTKTVI